MGKNEKQNFWCSFVLELSEISILWLVFAISVLKTFKKLIVVAMVYFDFLSYAFCNAITALLSS